MINTSLNGDVQQASSLVNNMGESLTRFNLLSKTSSEGVWDFNFITGAVYYNETIYALLGYSAEDMQDNITWWRGNIHPDDKDRVIGEIDKLLISTEHNWWGEYAFRCKNGQYKNVFERLYVARDNQGKPIRIIGTMMDLDPIAKLVRQLEEERISYRKDIMKESIASSEQERKEISEELHENINQVLAAINLHMDAAKKNIDAAGAEWLNNAQHLLVDSMNGIRVLSKRLSPLTFSTFGIHSAMVDLLDDVKNSRQLDYSFDYESAAMDFLPEDKKILLYRILDLYLQVIEKNGDVSVIQLSLKEVGKKIKLSITDNGSSHGAGWQSSSFSRIQIMVDAYDGTTNYQNNPGQGSLLEIVL